MFDTNTLSPRGERIKLVYQGAITDRKKSSSNVSGMHYLAPNN